MGRLKARRSKPRDRGPKLSEMFLVTAADASLSTEGRRRRHVMEETGRCPCGAKLEVPKGMKRGQQVVIEITHKDGCPAVISSDAFNQPSEEFVKWLADNTEKGGSN